MKRALFALMAMVLAVQFASADTLPAGVSQAQMDAAMSELSKLYGAPVVRTDQAKAICNQEKYVVECAEIGRRNGLFPKERAAKVDALLDTMKGEMVSKLKACDSVECLVDVARSVSKNLSAADPALARAVDLTAQKVEEKKVISDAAKSAGVDIRQCQTMDPDTAPLELLRGCAKLAKSKAIQKFIPEDQRERVDKSDNTIALKEALSKGELSCGDGTIEGCGKYCLSQSVGSADGAAIPAVCRDIAERFFGQEGIDELERAHKNVQQTFDDYKERYRAPEERFENRRFDDRNFAGTTTPARAVCPVLAYQPCPDGEYRQESVTELGCRVLGACIAFDTKTQPEPKEEGRGFICPALPTIDSCPRGAEKAISFVSPECGTYYAGKPSGGDKPPLPPQPAQERQCTQYGSGWHSMDQSGNCFNPSMTEYVTLGGALRTCTEAPAYGCSDTAGPSPHSYSAPPPSAGKKEQVWNDNGLRSWIRADADAARIDSLKQACAKVPQSANIWTPSAGTASSGDFGMPDPEKCGKAAACTSSQYFNGSQCVTSGSSTGTNPPACSSDQYWNGSACVVSPGGGGSALQRCFYPNATKSGQYVGYTVWCEADYVNCHEGSPSGASISLSGVALGAPSTCDSGWSGGSGTTGTVSGSCSSELVGILGTGCHSMGNAWFDSTMVNYVMPNTTQIKSCASAPISGCSGSGSGQTTSCPSGQYWNGSSCVNTSTTDCTSGQYWNGSACVSSTTTSCPSGQYWNGSACVNSTGTGTTDCSVYGSGWHTMDSSGNCFDSAMQNYKTVNGTLYSCASTPASGCSTSSQSCPSGQYWNGSSCVTTSTTSCTSGQYWNGSACVDSSTSPTPSSTSSSCGSGQYWDTRTNSCQSMQSACAEAGGTWDSATNYCRMPSSSADAKPLAFLCPSGHDWNGSYCVLKPLSGVEMYVANVLSAFRSLIGF